VLNELSALLQAKLRTEPRAGGGKSVVLQREGREGKRLVPSREFGKGKNCLGA